ncbi:RNA-directed DNA polymerase from transposon X-element [Paramuricea clavata]|uniref:RNA-directed DNA polymerase from transposon X-element n=1 Tax=Paramuricea clavata TaxID=317549 RepID=A0A7D9L0T7_PARCT|nr:RNA-directed DNA polymerase from transposon X-element [Paramuricea clavata]
MERVDMGDTPAPAISTGAIYKTADRFKEDSPEAAGLLTKSSYVDDLIDSHTTVSCAFKVAEEAENMLAKGGFSVKCWQLSGEESPRKTARGVNTEESGKLLNMLKGTESNLRVLGFGWDPRSDSILYEIVLNFSKKKHGVRTDPNLNADDLPKALPEILTKRIVLEQVMKINDPLGLVCPFTLRAKVYLRKVWSRKLGWDTPLPADITAKWIPFFMTLLTTQRCRRSPMAYISSLAMEVIWRTDWLTRGRNPDELAEDSEWWNGPPILYQPIESWGLKFGLQKNEALPGEKKIRYNATAVSEIPDIDYKKSSNVDRIIWMLARILSMARHKSFREGSTLHITSQLLKDADVLVVKDVQKEQNDEIEKMDQKGSRYASLNPGKDEHGYYVVGQRLKNNNPMTPDASLQKLLPTHHPVTRLFMERAHKQRVHRGRDSTLARFRQKYWIAQGSKIAQTVKSKFYGYETSFFLLALSRFARIRGWPEFIYSDPGSQLIGAERELKEAWEKIDRSELHKSGLQNGLTWQFGSSDSPWYQGAVESLVKADKRAIVFAVGKRRLTVPEFLTVCPEAANLLNERSIGTLPSLDSDLNVFTPNSRLLGRSTVNNPRGRQPFTYSQSPKTRYSLVQTAVEDFWEKWIQLYALSLVVRRKWHVNTRNLRPGDVVMIADKNVMRGEYHFGVVKEVFPDQDG